MPAPGTQMLYRMVPADFVEVFTRVGWSGIEKHYSVHARTVKRWIVICGEEGLRKRRRDYVKANGYNRCNGG